MNNNKEITVKDISKILGISVATVYNWKKSGIIKVSDKKNNTFSFYKIEELKENIESGKIKKLNNRANKSKINKSFIPNEYLKSNLNSINDIISFIKDNDIEMKLALFLLSLNLTIRENTVNKIYIEDIIKEKEISGKNKQIIKELQNWGNEISLHKIKLNYSFLLDVDLPKQRDILGLIYQGLLTEGKKAQNGSYYTPYNIVENITNNYVNKDSKVLDPCCGTGQFLLSFADKISNPKNIYGIDIDNIAVKIARINLLIKFKNRDFIPNIFCHNTLLSDLSQILKNQKFDVISTNPPWGFHFLEEDIVKLKKYYPDIKSLESFSYFLLKSIELLSNKGIISFILPESILNVKIHKDIREIILKNTNIKKVFYLDRVFKNVFTPVIRLDLSKQKEKKDIQIIKSAEKYMIPYLKWYNNNDYIFDVHSNKFDTRIIEKVYNLKHKTLKNNAQWALGIVTGNNKKYILTDKIEGSVPIYKGKDIEKFNLKEASSYILFKPKEFQQVAPLEKYYTKEKLIYKFISKKLVFAYDNKQKLTLNSANILIPTIENYPIKVIAGLLNSSLYQFVFQKKFSTIKVLKSHIEQLPLPLLSEEKIKIIINLVNNIIKNNTKDNLLKLDMYIFEIFNFSNDEIKYILNFVK